MMDLINRVTSVVRKQTDYKDVEFNGVSVKVNYWFCNSKGGWVKKTTNWHCNISINLMTGNPYTNNLQLLGR
jgi:hypothetical protein